MLLDHSIQLHEKFGKELSIKRGQAIYQVGDEVSAIYYLKSGIVKLGEDAANGQPVTLALLQPGEMFGFLDCINQCHEHSKYAIALTDVTLSSLPLEEVLPTFNNLPQIEKGIIQTLVNQLSESYKLIYIHVKMSAAERLGWYLRNLATYENGHYIVNLPLTHEELSFMVGCSRQKVTGFLNKWKLDGVIKYERGCIELIDLDRLQ